jgi:hypothetical protein
MSVAIVWRMTPTQKTIYKAKSVLCLKHCIGLYASVSYHCNHEAIATTEEVTSRCCSKSAEEGTSRL